MPTLNPSASMTPFYLFGSSKRWDPASWTTTDDRVRGGSSISRLIDLPNNSVRFYGFLDISTLGGAGFASQFSPLAAANSTSREDDVKGWDLSAYDGIEVSYANGDGKEYTLILKDELPARKRDDGREKAGTNWEVEFTAQKSGEDASAWFPWSAFNATFRGRPKTDAGDLRKGDVKRIGIMMRSQFGQQEGEFSVDLKYLSARKAQGDDDAIKAEL